MLIQLATAVEARPSRNHSTKKPFYSSTHYAIEMPATVESLLLSGNSDGTANVYVDDEVKIVITDAETGASYGEYGFDYSHGNSGRISPQPPTTITGSFSNLSGKTVNITTSFTDTYSVSRAGSAFFLTVS